MKAQGQDLAGRADARRQGGYLEYQFMCDECGKIRSRGNHERCSKLRQARYKEKGL